jgi:uncharacterized membrane protein YphA (DoxX/SURF4 family)
MEWMDGVRRWGGLLWVGGGVAFEMTNLLQRGAMPGVVTLIIAAGVLALAAAILFHAQSRNVWAAGWLASILLGLDFLGAVADRFGLLGAPGAPGVSWGSWDAFVDYTASVMPFANRWMVDAAAVGATVAECAIGLLLVLGFQRRWVAKASAGLLFGYLVLMATSLGASEVADYALPIFIGGSLLVSSIPVRRTPPVRGEDRLPAMSTPA